MRTRHHARPALTGVALIATLALAACGGDDKGDDGGSASSGGGRRAHRPAAARDEDDALRGARPAGLRGEGQGAVPGLHGRLRERDPGRHQAADPGRGRADQRRRRARARRRRRRLGRPDRLAGPAAQGAGHRLRPADLRPAHRLLRLLRQRPPGPAAGRRASSTGSASPAKGKPVVMINGAPTDPSAGDYKKGAHQALDAGGRRHREGVRHARLEPGQGPAPDGAGDHRAGQERLRRRLLRQRRHGGRRDRRDEGRAASTRPGSRSPAATARSRRCSAS